VPCQEACQRSFRDRTLILLVLGLVGFPCFKVALATPFVPTDDAQVLERLRTAPLDTQARERRQLRAALARQPDNLELAVRLAKRYIERGRAESDPRYYGRAQAILHPWWNMPRPPPVILVLRATVRQSYHDFDGALEDLSLALRLAPNNPQAWVTGAMVLQTRGAYREAKRHCTPLLRLTTRLVAVTCLSSVSSFSGQAAKSYGVLRRELEHNPDTAPGAKRWALTVLADIAARMGQSQEAEAHFKQVLSLGLPDGYLLGLYADFLLDQGRPAEVVALLQDTTRADALLLRLTLAQQALDSPALAAHVTALRARFDASRRRRDMRHLREEARFTLHLLRQPGAALRLAQANWAMQREPEDARILLESALAAGDASAAKVILDWVETTRLEDVHLARLRRQLQGAQP
jgi:Tfp pilus assembly protein PilF